MSEKEKEILTSISEALPLMSERKKGEFMGYAQALVDMKKGEAGKEQQEEERGDANGTERNKDCD